MPAKPARRRFAAEYKLRVLREAERLNEPGAIGALLRREGLYSTHLSAGRRQRDRGGLETLRGRRRGRTPDPAAAWRERIAALEAEQARLEERLRQAEAILAAPKNVSEIVGRPGAAQRESAGWREAQFKTLTYHPTCPQRFGSVQDARAVCRGFFDWYNPEHRHDGLGLLAPEVVPSGRTEAVLERRRAILAAAYATHPERFVRKPPEPAAPPAAVWINPPGPAVMEVPHYMRRVGVSKSLGCGSFATR